MKQQSGSDELWRLTMEHSPIGMALVGLDGRLLMCNRALCEMLGRTAADLAQLGFQEITHPADLDTDVDLFGRTLAGEIDSYRISKRFLHLDGRVVWGDLSVALVRDHDGQAQHFISQVVDMTEQRQHEQRLEAATLAAEHERQVMETIFETVGVGLLLIGPDGRYERMNRHHEHAMRLSFPDGHAGQAGQLGHVYHLDGTTLMSEEEMPSFRAAQGEEFDDRSFWSGDDPMTRAAYSVTARQVRGPTGEPLGAALAYKETTDLMRAMQAKNEFVSSVSHELRTPLTAVLGHLEILCEHEGLPDTVANQLTVVRRNALRLRTLVSDLLHVAQTGEAGLQLHRATLDLSAVARDAVELACPMARTRGITLTLDAPDSTLLFADEGRLRQVLDNLISNGLKYTEPGGEVRVSLRQLDQSVELAVHDTGLGIAAGEIDQVFGRFFRGGEATQRQITGTGLGLNIVHTIVTAHGGTIVVDSEVGQGSTFSVCLPSVGH